MQFSMPTTAIGLTIAALAATQLLTAASLPPGHTAAAQTVSSVSVAAPTPQHGDRYSDARDLVDSQLETVSAAVAANTVEGPLVEAARLALDGEISEASAYAPSELAFASSPRGFLTGGEAALVITLESELADLEESFAAWQQAIEQTRADQAAELATQAAAAATAATQASAATSPTSGGGSTAAWAAPASAPGAHPFTVNPVGTGGQALIDACAGPVWWTPSWYPYLAEHWHCGGAAFPRHAGAIVAIAGSGVYQSAGVVMQVNAYVDDMTAVPAGYDVYYQTCLNNNPETAVVIGLTRIG